MAFFPRAFYNQDSTSFTPLFRLLDDFDNYSRQGSGHGSRRTCAAAAPQFQPKFDVRETGESYELHGELAGLSKEDVRIEFTEPQTMLIRGKVERTYTAGSPPTGGQVEDTAMSGALTEAEAEEPKNSPRQATVEDGDDDANNNEFEVVENEKPTEEKVQEKPANKPADKAKYWLTERSIGEFSRSFNFPSRVDQDAVTAAFQDGILSITVPKAKKHESRRIAIH